MESGGPTGGGGLSNVAKLYIPLVYTAELARGGVRLSVIDRILHEDKQAAPKQRHTTARLYARFRDELGYTGIRFSRGGAQLLFRVFAD